MKNLENAYTFENLLETLKTIGGGEFHTIEFYSIVDGAKLAYGKRKNPTANPNPMYKISKVQIRTKLDYEHTKRYQDYCAEHGNPTPKNENSTYILDKAIKHNNNTNNDLWMVIPKYESFESYYFEMDGTSIDLAEAKSRLAPKKENSEPPYVMSINARQVLAIN